MVIIWGWGGRTFESHSNDTKKSNDLLKSYTSLFSGTEG